MANISLNDTDMTAFGVHDTLGRLPSDLGVLTAKQGSLGRKPAADRTLRVSGCSAAGGLTPVTAAQRRRTPQRRKAQAGEVNLGGF